MYLVFQSLFFLIGSTLGAIYVYTGNFDISIRTRKSIFLISSLFFIVGMMMSFAWFLMSGYIFVAILGLWTLIFTAFGTIVAMLEKK